MEEAFELHVFRVEEGLGNACAIRLPDGSWGLVDWGTENDETLERLLALLGGRDLDFVVASHAHADHTLGLARLFGSLDERDRRVRSFYYPASTLHRPTHDLTAARRKALELGIEQSPLGVPRRPPHHLPEPVPVACEESGGWGVWVLAPLSSDIARSELQAERRAEVPGNDTSLVILAAFAGQPRAPAYGRLVLPGDATPSTLTQARDIAEHYPHFALHNQALLVPHHGSRHNLPTWVRRFSHGLAVISAPTGSLHHPAADALLRLRQWSLRIFCTSYAGCCRERAGPAAARTERELIEPGPCFGDLSLRIPRRSEAVVETSSDNGEPRRRFGLCGGPAALVGLGGGSGGGRHG